MNISKELKELAMEIRSIKIAPRREPISAEIITGADRLHQLCINRGVITIKEAQKILQMPGKELERLAWILEQGELVEVEYSIFETRIKAKE